MYLVSQLDGGLHVQYLAYEWAIVQGLAWHFQMSWSIFWLFFTSQTSSEHIRAVQGVVGDPHEGDGLRRRVLVRHPVVAVAAHEDLDRLVEPTVSCDHENL